MFRFPNELMKRTKKNAPEGFREITILLNKDSIERFGRLKSRLPKQHENDLIALALRCLEQRVDSIVKKRVMKRLRTSKTEGLSTTDRDFPHLNAEIVPTLKRQLLTKIKKDRQK